MKRSLAILRSALCKMFVCLWAVAMIGPACARESGPIVRAPASTETFAYFSTSSNDVVAIESVLASSETSFVRYSSQGHLVHRSALQGFVIPLPGRTALIDNDTLLLRRVGRDPRQFNVSASLDPHSLASKVAIWLSNAGGLFDDWHQAVAVANPSNGLSCAIGADRSIAIWRVGEAETFVASAPDRFASTITGISGVFCLAADDVSYVVISGIDNARPTGSREQLFVFRAGQNQPEVVLDIGADAMDGVPYFESYADGIAAFTRAGNGESRGVRLARRGGTWRIERAGFLNWPGDGVTIVGARSGALIVGDQRLGGVARVAWPADSGEVPYQPSLLMRASTPFEMNALRAGYVDVSSRDDAVLWVDPGAGGGFSVEFVGRRNGRF